MRAVRTTLRRMDRATLDRLARIELMIFDVDGVLTDGRLYFDGQGEALKVFHVHDGAGIKALAAAGIVPAIISGRESPMVVRRCSELGIRHVVQGSHDKNAAFDAMRFELGMTAEVCGFMGDDDADIPVMRRVGFAATVPAAADGVADVAHWVSRREGGAGAVRELCDLLVGARLADRDAVAGRSPRRA